MTKKELADQLSHWPDDAIVELSICPDADMKSKGESDRIWYELEGVEKRNEQCIDSDCVHLLLFGGLVTMC